MLAEVVARAKKEADEAEQRLLALASEYSPEAIFAATLVLMVMAPEGTASELTHGDVPSKLERLAFHLWRCPTPGTKEPTGEIIQSTLEAIYRLARQSVTAQIFEPGRPKDDLDHLMTRLSVDAQIIRGSAYPEQTSEELCEIAGFFDEWFARKLGHRPKQLVHVLWAIWWATNLKINNWLHGVFKEAKSSAKAIRVASKRRRRSFSTDNTELQGHRQVYDDTALRRITAEAYSVIPLSRTECVLPDGLHPTEELWETLISLIGLKPENAVGAHDFLVSRRRPLFVFTDGRVLFLDLSNGLDCLWDSLDAYARTDEHFYNRFQKRKADWLEEKMVECSCRVFGEDHVYRGLTYPNPDKPGQKATAELDAAIHWGPFLVLVEAKAKQFRLEGQLGDVGRLRTDLKANVEDAFEQAMRAQRYLASVDEACFRERKNDRVLRVRMQGLRRVYLVTVSLHLLGTAINRLANLKTLGMFAAGDYPWAVSVADFDIITHFVGGPDVFLHYLERRREVERSDVFSINDDIDLFGAYLKTRLHPSAFPKKGKRHQHIMLTGFQIPFDEWMEYRRGTRREPPDIRLEVPETIGAVLQELRSRGDDDGARWIAFALLGLSSSQLAAVAANIQEAHLQVPQAGMYRRLAITFEDLAVSMTITADRPEDELRRRTQLRAAVEKYRRKVSRSIGFGVHLGQQGKLFDCCVWVDGPWEPNPEMERLLETEPPFFPAPGQKLPGRNAPCVCGSNKKFKKCCLPRIGVVPEIYW